MELINISNLGVDKYSRISFAMNKKDIIGVFSNNKNVVSSFLLLLAGINKQKNIFYKDINVFDNKEYFKKRIYIDFEKAMFSTLKVDDISQITYNRYQKDINTSTLKNNIKEYHLYSEVDITETYNFTKKGKTLMAFSYLSSLDSSIVIINNPTINLVNFNNVKEYVTKITNTSRYDLVVLGVDNLSVISSKINKILIFDDYKNTYYMDVNTVLLVIDQKLEDIKIDSLTDKIKPLFISKDKKRLVVLNNLNKDDLKILSKNKISYIFITIKELENYM